MLPPPADLSPGRLFRLLLELRPRLPLEERLAIAPDLELWARAPTPSDRRAIVDASAKDAALIAATLCDRDGQGLLSVADVGLLQEREVSDLTRGIGAALIRCAPQYASIDIDAWMRVLRTGGDDPSNAVAAMALAGAFDGGGYTRVTERPDIYWGVPLSELLDGHWLVYRVCRQRYEERAK